MPKHDLQRILSSAVIRNLQPDDESIRLLLESNYSPLHQRQQQIRDSMAKRKVVRAGRRGGKTFLAARLASERLVAGDRVLYATPTQNQFERFWMYVVQNLQPALDVGYFKKNETKHKISRPGNPENSLMAKTAWNEDTLRGDYATFLILDEYQNMEEGAWLLVGAPMMLDTDGDVLFIYTVRRGQKGDHARRIFKRAQEDTTGRWEAFSFSSHDNTYLSQDALEEVSSDMTKVGYKAEILAEELEDDPDASWKRDIINGSRISGEPPPLQRIVVGVDPPGTVGTECGIVIVGSALVGDEWHYYVLEDKSLLGSPEKWGRAVHKAYKFFMADRVVGEINFGGDMVESVIRSTAGDDPISFKSVRASRGKVVRAEPVVALYERGRVHHVGDFEQLENEMCSYVPTRGAASPNRMDALVWALTEVAGITAVTLRDMEGLGTIDEYRSAYY